MNILQSNVREKRSDTIKWLTYKKQDIIRKNHIIE